MILDTSVILAIIQREPGWEHHGQTLQAAEHLLISACTLQIFQRSGKGEGHGAQLNFGDCFAAALASERELPLAFQGDGFAAAGY